MNSGQKPRSQPWHLEMNVSLNMRCIILLASLCIMQVSVSAIVRGYTSTEVTPLRTQLTSLPRSLDEFNGEDVSLDAKVFQSLDADQTVTRQYTTANGELVSVHLATWNQADGLTPHLPDICLRGAGYEISSQFKRKVQDGNASFEASVITGHRTTTSDQITGFYWYQVGSQTYTDRNGGKGVLREYWSQQKRPAVLKVLLAVNNLPPKAAEKILQKISVPVYQWIKTIQD